MSYMHYPVIAVMGLFLCAFLVEIFGARNKYVRAGISLVATGVAFGLMCLLIKPVLFDNEVIVYWMGNWEPVSGYAIGIGYEVDALSLFFALIASFTSFMSCIYSVRYMERDSHLGHYYTLCLMLQGSIMGLVMTGDIFNMFVMIEIMTFAAVALTAFRNEKKGALEGAFKYLVIGSIGSSMTLTGVAVLYASCHTLNMAQLASMLSGGLNTTTIFAFALIVAGFGVKAFIVPFHTPAADAYTVAPTSVSMLFSGMVNKAGVYGMIRICYTVFHAMDDSALQILLVAFGTVTMFVGVTMALAQHDFKRLLAFHSISQIGYVIAAIGLGTAVGITGGLFHALNHTLFKGLLFLTAGAVLKQTGTTNLDKLGGLSKRMPCTTICFLIGAFSIAGLPPFNGFASKWMIYQAAWSKGVETGNFFYVFVTIVAVVVSVMTLASFIKVTQAVFFGQERPELSRVREVPFAMQLPMWIMSAFCVLTGVFYDVIYNRVLFPALVSTLNAVNYIDSAMGRGFSALAGVSNHQVAAPAFSIWSPVLWLLLFVIVFVAVALVVILGAPTRGKVLQAPLEPEDGKHANFFGGEYAVRSHVSGSDLFWGFKKDWKGYFRVMEGAHSGNVNDYASWAVVGTAIITLFVVMFIR